MKTRREAKATFATYDDDVYIVDVDPVWAGQLTTLKEWYDVCQSEFRHIRRADIRSVQIDCVEITETPISSNTYYRVK